jgi:signal transduction histidine kinase
VDSTEQEQSAQRNRATGQASPAQQGIRAERIAEGIGARTAASPESAAPDTAQLDEIEAFVNLGRWIWDVGTGALTCSPQLVRIYGLASPALMPNSDSFLLRVHHSDRTRVRASIMRALGTGEPFQFQQRVIRMDNEVRVLRTRGTIERGSDGKPARILGISQDVTELHAADIRAQERLKQVARRALDREEQDRNLITRDLRQRVAEPLVALGKKLAGANAGGAAPETASVAAQLDECISSINTIGTATLQIAGRLRPSVLEEHGLYAALRAEALRTGRAASIPVSATGEEVSPRLPIGVETALFRLAQEALSNAARHAGCTLIRVSLTTSQAHVRLEIQDNGSGFDAAPFSAREAGGTGGLDLMRERAEAVSATFRLSSQSGMGTRITVDYRG